MKTKTMVSIETFDAIALDVTCHVDASAEHQMFPCMVTRPLKYSTPWVLLFNLNVALPYPHEIEA
jgi:hypothetical protein